MKCQTVRKPIRTDTIYTMFYNASKTGLLKRCIRYWCICGVFNWLQLVGCWGPLFKEAITIFSVRLQIYIQTCPFWIHCIKYHLFMFVCGQTWDKHCNNFSNFFIIMSYHYARVTKIVIFIITRTNDFYYIIFNFYNASVRYVSNYSKFTESVEYSNS